MTLTLSSEDLDQLWEESRQNGETRYCSDGIESYEEHPAWLAKGSGRFIELRHGLSLSTCSAVYLQDVKVHVQHSDSFPLTANFYLSGHSRVKTLQTKDDYLREYIECPGENYLFYLPAIEEIEECFAHQPRQIVKLWFTFDFLESFCTSQMGALPDELHHLIQGNTQSRFYRPLGRITPAMQVALQQILNCPYQGWMKQMYLESKAIELLTLQIAQWMEDSQHTQPSIKLHAGDVERIYQAKEILIQRLDNPPSLLSLARQVGLNDRKLKQGFRQVFGTTAFGYLHNQRMERARSLLLENQLSVTVVAHSVGYTNLCAFSTAFRKKFGINPRALAQQHR
jgi:AraC family transcriptional regulator, transcriptional activator of the genes for pyochelin and ferripyochelin receptors